MYSQNKNRYRYNLEEGGNTKNLVYVAQLQEYKHMLNRLNRENQYLSNNVLDLIKENSTLKNQMHKRNVYEVKKEESPRNRSKHDINNNAKESPFRANKVREGLDMRGKETNDDEKTNNMYMVQKIRDQQRQDDLRTHPTPTIIEELEEERFVTNRRKGLKLTKSAEGRERSDNLQQSLQNEKEEGDMKKSVPKENSEYPSIDEKQSEIKKENPIAEINNPEKTKKRMVTENQNKNYLYRNNASKKVTINLKKDNTPYRVVSSEEKAKEVAMKSNSSTRVSNQLYKDSPYRYYVEPVKPYSPIKTYNRISYKY